MLFNSIEFLFIFLPIVFIIYFLLGKIGLIKYTNLWLACASLYFYAYYKIEYLPIIISSVIFNYIMGYFIQKGYSHNIKKFLLIFTVCGNLFLLCYYKYFNFLIETLNRFSFTHFDTMKILLPLGISFFTFQQISFIYDMYKGEAKQTNIVDYTLFVLFFPQLIAGPICTFKELIPQFEDKTKKFINRENIYLGIFFISIGLFKKVILADNFTNFIQDVITMNAMTEFFTTWSFAFSVALQGYFDFSGYCDIALGSAFLFNINLPWNFNSPYKAQSIADYWNRWNMTLMRFLKDYIYTPLGGNSKGLLKTFYNIMIVFFIYGCWQYINIVNILYGIINGILVFINKIWEKTNIKIPKPISIGITFITLILLSTFIMTKDLSQSITLLNTMFGINAQHSDIMFINWNLAFILQPPHNAQINILLLLSSFVILLFGKNSNELAQIYVKANNNIYTIILVIAFIFATLSITKSTEFLYFIF